MNYTFAVIHNNVELDHLTEKEFHEGDGYGVHDHAVELLHRNPAAKCVDVWTETGVQVEQVYR